jgi:uncharacterized protein with PCYCGC motif
MGKKNKLPKPTLADSKDAIVFGGAILLLLLLMPYAIYRFTSSTSARLDPNQVPVHFKRVEDARPFPQTLDPAQFQIANIREAYSVAKEMPAVLAQQPCYCYCQRQGHRSLLDCFKSFQATSWDICINEARLAGQLSRQGKTAEEIRGAIVQKQGVNLGSSK